MEKKNMSEEMYFDSILSFETRTLYHGKKQIGILYNKEDIPAEHNKSLVEWCVGAWKWAEKGNWITEDREWLDKSTNTYYEDGDDFILDFCKVAYEDNPIVYFFLENIGIKLSKQNGKLFTCGEFKDWIIEQIQEEFWVDPECDGDDTEMFEAFDWRYND